jgi:hypothetical protein
VLLRLAYLGLTNVFALLRLLPVSDQAKEAEILALRHQIIVLERQLGKARPRFSLADRAFLAALLHRLPRDVLGRFRLLVRPETMLRWHRDLLARRHAARSLWVPKTCVTWADVVQIALGPSPRSGAGPAGLGPGWGAMILGLWA